MSFDDKIKNENHHTKDSKIHGWLNIYKPKGMTSTKVVSFVRKYLNIRKIGHGGTLDPLAEGVLPLAIGEATKTVNYIMDHTKVYEFEITWGSQTTTDDLEGVIIATSDKRPTQEEIIENIGHFKGDIEQVPPQYSAVKVDGQRAYKLARVNKVVELKPRLVVIKDFRLEQIMCPDRAVFQVTCGKGTYVRSLARDIALKLGTYGHVSKLERLQVGKFYKDNAIFLENIQELGHKVLLEGYVYPIADVLDDIPAVCIDEEQQRRLLQGQAIFLVPPQANGLLPGRVLCIQESGQALAIGTYEQGFVQPNRVFNI